MKRIQTFGLDELVGLAAAELPHRCNVFARIAESPSHSAHRGGRWMFGVEALSRQRARAIVSVHQAPQDANLGLDYGATSPTLLATFDEPTLRAGFAPGELVMIQAQPKIGVEGLYLNVPTILIVRPFLTFGRRQVDYVSSCMRRSYLSVFKGVRRRDRDRGPVIQSSSVKGELVHEAFALLAAEERSESTMALLREAVTPRTLRNLVFIGLDDPNEMRFAVNGAVRAIDAARASETVRAVLRADHWRPESDALDNGVTTAPDLLGERHVLELKVRNPNVDGTVEQGRQQVEAYLAWAMVEYGLEYVLENVRGCLVNLHQDVSEVERVLWVEPQAHQVEQRIRQRHELASLALGTELARPDHRCGPCAFKHGDEEVVSSTDVPAACPYHCQLERNWDCAEKDGPICPLLEVCDQYDQYEDYQRVDAFNRLRQVLLVEEEQQVALQQLVEVLVHEERGDGFLFSGFTIVDYQKGQVRMEPPAELRQFRFAAPGQDFVALDPNHKPVARLRFKRWKKGRMIFQETRVGAVPNPVGRTVDLRFIPGPRYNARHQLYDLEWIQRIGEEPIWLRDGREPSDDPRDHGTLDEALAAPGPVLLIDAPGRFAVRTAVRDVVRKLEGQVLVISDGESELSLGKNAVAVDGVSLAERLSGDASPLKRAIEGIVDELQAASVWVAPRETVYDRSLLESRWARNRFTDVVIVGAETFPLLAFTQLVDPLRRLIVIGDRLGGSISAESPDARNSPFFQNSLRFLWEAGRFALPSRVGRLGRLSLPRVGPRAAFELALDGESVPSVSGFEMHTVEGQVCLESRSFTLSAEVTPNGDQGLRMVKLEVLDPIAWRELRFLIRSVSARDLERITPAEKDRLDSTVLGVRARIVDVEISAIMGGVHRLEVRIPSASMPMLDERGLENPAEAEALVRYAKEHPAQRFHAVSPFVAQALRIARVAADEAISNLQVFTLDRLGSVGVSADALLVSVVVAACRVYPYPMDDVGRVTDLLGSGYPNIVIFTASSTSVGHPVLRAVRACCSR